MNEGGQASQRGKTRSEFIGIVHKVHSVGAELTAVRIEDGRRIQKI